MPLIEQLPAVDEYEGIHLSFRDHPGGHSSFAERSGRTENAIIVFSNY
jgi:hypothetical protein